MDRFHHVETAANSDRTIMLLQIEHKILYRYERPVFLEPMVIRLRPRHDFTQHAIRFSLEVDPEPPRRNEAIDAAGNVITVLGFDDTQKYLRIAASSEVRTLSVDPFDYLLTDPAAAKLPYRYGPEDHHVLAPYCKRSHSSAAVEDLAHQIKEKAGANTQSFLYELAGHLNKICKRTTRPEGAAWRPEKTLSQRQGACRDLAELFIDACRVVGLAARFVSGYKHEPDAEDERELHAWSEVYLPGAGWRGYDPSLGLATACQHVPIACSVDAASTAPAVGTFRGTGVTSSLQFEITIEERGEGRGSRGEERGAS